MRSMEVHFGVIRDKEGICSALRHSRSAHRQLAVCFSTDGKLLVKICTVRDIVTTNNGINVVLSSPGEDQDETIIRLDRIRSVYPIRDFI